ncbi:MAG: fibronectin type III domain-containing protein, partial [Phycisphaerales bacterium]|nr:fibronectin type III domain-containing protein [Phycisphaerales bacterium]
MRVWNKLTLVGMMVLMMGATACSAAAVHFGNTMKIGEVTPTTAIVWTRLTSRSELNRDGIAWPKWSKEKCIARPLPVPKDKTLADMAGAMPAAAGEVRLTLSDPDGKVVYQSEFVAVDPKEDSTKQFSVTGLTPGTNYAVRLDARKPGGALVFAAQS